jgi:hypothetical protein
LIRAKIELALPLWLISLDDGAAQEQPVAAPLHLGDAQCANC